MKVKGTLGSLIQQVGIGEVILVEVFALKPKRSKGDQGHKPANHIKFNLPFKTHAND